MLNRSALVLTVALLATAVLTGVAGTAPPASNHAGRPDASQAARVEVLVDGIARPQYWSSGARYIEALKGRPYEIRITNPYPVRVAVALSVDGLNTIDARHTTAANGRKWVIDAFETITLSGWQVSLSHARRFEFTTEARSYGQSLGKTDDLGIISAVFFRERLPVRQPALLESPQAPDSPSANAPSAAPAQKDAAARSQGGAAAPAAAHEADEYAATGIGARTDHAVQQVQLVLEETPAASVSIRYEFRSQLVRLGILPAPQDDDDRLARRQHAHGFVPGFCPDPKR